MFDAMLGGGFEVVIGFGFGRRGATPVPVTSGDPIDMGGDTCIGGEILIDGAAANNQEYLF